MKISNAQFGTITIDEETILTLSEGLYAFEELKRFALVVSPDLAPFQWLVAVDEPEVVFAVIDPLFVRPDFEVELSRADRAALEAGPEDPLAALVIANVTDKGVSANLRGPILINGRNRRARQIVLHRPDYAIDCPLSRTDSQDGIEVATEGPHARTHSSAG